MGHVLFLGIQTFLETQQAASSDMSVLAARMNSRDFTGGPKHIPIGHDIPVLFVLSDILTEW